jgi:hypothetical protein
MRRKIYEKFIVFEASVSKLEDLLLSKNSYEEKKSILKYNPNNLFEEVKNTYLILITLTYFFLNKKSFQNEFKFEKEFNILKFEEKDLHKFLIRNKNFTLRQKFLIKRVEFFFRKSQNIDSYRKAKSMLNLFDKLNVLFGVILKLPTKNIK